MEGRAVQRRIQSEREFCVGTLVEDVESKRKKKPFRSRAIYKKITELEEPPKRHGQKDMVNGQDGGSLLIGKQERDNLVKKIKQVVLGKSV